MTPSAEPHTHDRGDVPPVAACPTSSLPATRRAVQWSSRCPRATSSEPRARACCRPPSSQVRGGQSRIRRSPRRVLVWRYISRAMSRSERPTAIRRRTSHSPVAKAGHDGGGSLPAVQPLDDVRVHDAQHRAQEESGVVSLLSLGSLLPRWSLRFSRDALRHIAAKDAD